MDSKKAETLLKKYWEGKTDLKEEMALKQHFSSTVKQDNAQSDYFKYLNQKSNQNSLGGKFDKELLDSIEKPNSSTNVTVFPSKYWYIAASLILLLSLSIIFKNRIFESKVSQQIVMVDTYEDPEKAFEETKKALLLISSMLNQGSEYAAEFSKFEQSQKQVKQKK